MIIAIDGPAGGGKTELSRRVAEGCGLDAEAQVIHGDHYYEPAELGGDVVDGTPAGFNSRRFMREIGNPINEGTELKVREYRFTTGEFHDRPRPDRNDLIVVEGIKILGLPVQWNLKIWVHTPRSLREERYLNRPSHHRRMQITDRDVLKNRFNLWADDAEIYERRVNPHERDDVLVLDGTADKHTQLMAISKALVEIAET